MNDIEKNLRNLLVKLSEIQQYYVDHPFEEADKSLLQELEEKVTELEKLYNDIEQQSSE